ncbi:hypothetical protein [Klebsiella grimontii]|uniref:hypothetical protein n=1 Tax=Klebsiella grimontii TaxID=2058152 RepID=UPI001F4C9D33|nr:hypothetical protein [Klebsiella grimontii]UNF14563.1 hypothetical protein L6506_09055 [Klebsiella grimontii]
MPRRFVNPGTFPGGGAMRLSGLPPRRALLTRSPVSAAQREPGRCHADSSTPAHIPEAARGACPGYRPAERC